MNRTPETMFHAFRRTGDAAALAGAFDATASELLRVAQFLLPRDEVEDAVHDTYVVAMSRREAWDGQRPLLPWLLGILANEARGRRRRRRQHTLAVPAVQPAAEPDPVKAAQAAEFGAGLTQALQELPRHDAELLRLHLHEELSCREIGERLRRPAGTVRTQVSRAMGELRRRLPVALGAGMPIGELLPGVLAALRVRVIASGSGATAATVALVSRPRSILLAAASVGLIAGVVLLATSFVFDGATPDAAPIASVQQPAPQPEHAPAVAASNDSTAAAASITTPERAPVTVPAAVPAKWELRGRVHDESGTGIVGARINLRHGEFEPLITFALSGADGVFALDLSFWRDRPAVDRQQGFFAKVHAIGHNTFPHFGRFPEDSDASHQLTLEADFELSPYATISGRVVDPSGQPVPALVMADDPSDAGHSLGMAHAELDGTFSIVVAGIDEGPVMLEAMHASGVMISTKTVVKAGVDTDVGTLTLLEGYPVVGRVVIADGTPLADCEVSLVCANVRASTRLHTKADGMFTYVRPLAGAWSAQPMGVSFLDGGGWGPKFEFTANETVTELRLDGVLVELQWFDPAGRELLPQYTVAEVYREGEQKPMAQQNGKLKYLVVPSRSRVRVTAALPSLVAAQELIAPARGRQRYDLRYRPVPRAPFRVELTWDDGKPVLEFECRVLGTESGATVYGQQTSVGPGRSEQLAPIGKVCIHARGYPSHYDGGDVEANAVVAADGGSVAKVTIPRRGRIAITLKDTAAPTRIDDELSADIRVAGEEIGHFVYTEGDTETTSSEPPLGRRLETLLLLAPGRQEIEFEAEGWLPVKTTVDVRADQLVDVVIWLQKK